jgi:cyclin H
MEDTIYTTSTQYRLFTYTPQQLSDLRHATNRAAAEKITASIKAARAAGDRDDADNDGDEEIDCPTAEEELKLVAYYCVKCMQLSDHFKFPSAVKVVLPRLSRAVID